MNCIDKYIVMINDQQMETTVTSLSVPNLSIGSVYNITVYSQDSDNRNGSSSELLMITWDGKLYNYNDIIIIFIVLIIQFHFQ